MLDLWRRKIPRKNLFFFKKYSQANIINDKSYFKDS